MKLSEAFKLEIPYNFDKELVYRLREEPYISTILKRAVFMYMPSFHEDADNTRKESSMYKLLAPQTREEYIEHVRLIQDNLHVPVAVLLQYASASILDNLSFYRDLGIRVFITGSDDIATHLKSAYQDSTVIASITKKLTFQEIMENPLDMYDVIVLDFPFERGLNRVKQLPKTHEYSLLVNNSGCLVDCNQTEHWWCGRPACQYFHKTGYGQERALSLNNADHNAFLGYVQHYKIQGRDYPTQQILDSLDYLLTDDNASRHSSDWLNYSDKLGLFDGTYQRDTLKYDCVANRDLKDFSFFLESTSYSWTRGKTYQVVIDIQFGNIHITSDKGVLLVPFPIYADIVIFMKEMFSLELTADVIGGDTDEG